ncbi:hypothetical protein ENUP19_0061G0146 [Entamoeba nuttalli]
MNKKIIGHYEIMIVSMYFNDINDFINLELAVKRFKGNMERFHFNPISLTTKTLKYFPSLETLHLYNRNDKELHNKQIIKYIIWYKVSYTYYMKHKSNTLREFKNITFNEDDVTNFGYEIPKQIKIVKKNCFINNHSFKEITIPPSVLSIHRSCLWVCKQLRSLKIPQQDYIIFSNHLFFNFHNLCSLELPNSIVKINNKKIPSIQNNQIFNIPTTVTSLNNYCFSECSSLLSIQIPSSVILIGNSAFKKCYFLQVIQLPIDILTLPKSCFALCTSLQTIILPNSLKCLRDKCFVNCYSLHSITIPNSVSQIGSHCFEGCRSLSSVILSTSLSSISSNCFSFCSSLRSITLHTSILSIETYSFKNCYSLTTVQINSPLCSIDPTSFEGCINLHEI